MKIKQNDLKQTYDIVIIGGGITGLALSRFLNLENRKILIVEAGNFKFDKKINNKSFASSQELGNWPSKNYSSFYSRVRMFGGNANVWGGWCMELDGYDFKNNEIWSSLKDDLKTHYLQAYKLLNINTKKIENSKLNLKSVNPYTINVSRGNFINECRNYVIENKNIDLLLNSELAKINLEDNSVNSIIIKNNNGTESIVNLSRLIISAGGIESTKIILENLPKNKHNENLGKFFMEHPQIQVGRVNIMNSKINKFIKKFSPPTARHLFDDKLNIQKDKFFSGFKSTNQEVRNYFVLRSSDVYQSRGLYRLRHIILTKSFSSTGKVTINDTFNLIIDIFNLIYRKLISFFSLNQSYSVVLHLEQKPDKSNQIFFDEKENLILNWNFTEHDLNNLMHSIKDLNIIFNEMNARFYLKNIFEQDTKILKKYLKKHIFGIGHHLGTTRIGRSSSDSVCDTDLKYHGIKNLYLNSTSVFPTGGIANPTLTMLALTSRLAEKLNNE